MSIRKRGKTHQVRLPGERPRSFPTRAAAEKYELDRKLARSLGDLHDVEPIQFVEAMYGYFQRWQVNKQPRLSTVDRALDAFKFLEREFGPLLLNQIGLVLAEDAFYNYAAEHPNAAKKSMEWFKRTLRDARRRGQKFDLALLEMDPIRVVSRRGIALDVDQLDRLGSWFPEHLSTMVPLVGSVGLRIGEALGLTDDRVDVKRRRLFIPADLCKEGRDKSIELTDDEAKLLAAQLIERPAGTPFLYPRLGGGRHTVDRYDDHSYFYEKVWHPAREAAAREWRDDHNKSAWDATPYDELVPHDLRHTAISLMAAGGMRPETIADRVGHKDGGKLILQRYRHLFDDELTTHLRRYESFLRDRRRARRQLAEARA
jgi:integrase